MRTSDGKRWRSAGTLLLLLCGAGIPYAAQADIYAYRDAKGVLHISNVPDNREYRLVSALQGSSTASPPAPRAAATAADSASKQKLGPLIDEAAQLYAVDPALLRAVISAESGYNPRALSRKGAAGLMQLMPDTARRYGVDDVYDPAQNIRGGAQYLRDLLKTFDNDLELAIAAYNAGEKAVVDAGRRIPPYRETLAYVPKVLKLHKKYQALL